MVQSGGDLNTVLHDNKTLSVVVYVANRENAIALDQMLFSLAIQHWRELEITIAIESTDADDRRKIVEAVEAQPWPATLRYKIFSPEPGDTRQRRGALLNHAVKETAGRFLTILDAGEVVVYQHGYSALIGRLLESGGAVAVGGCRTARVRQDSPNQFIEAKYDFTLGLAPFRLFANRPPLGCHIIDRSRVGTSALRFAEDGRTDCDRDFLARLYGAFPPDLSLRDVFVCERRLHMGGRQGILYRAAIAGHAVREALRTLSGPRDSTPDEPR